MSSYLNIYIKKGEDYTSLFYQGRSSYVYSYLEDSYGHLKKLEEDDIDKAIAYLNDKKRELDTKIEKTRKKMEMFNKTQCKYSEWNTAYLDNETYIEDIETDINEIEYAIGIFNTLSLIAYNCSVCGKDGYMTLWYGIDIAEDDNGNPIINKKEKK